MDIREDPALVRKHLAQAERDVGLGTRHVERQREIIAELGRDGHPTEQAEQLLQTFEDSLSLHVSERDRLQKELAKW